MSFQYVSCLQVMIFVTALLLMGCTVISPNVDKKLGENGATQVEQTSGIYPLPRLNHYVDQVGQRLVKQLDETPFEFNFYVVDEEMVNAFALPGGHIYITRGLLLLMVNEDELAAVLAHEISHVTERHSIQAIGEGLTPSLLELPGNLISLVAPNIGGVLNAPITTSNQLLLASFSRGHEIEADAKGVHLAAKAGYKPLAMADILNRMNEYVEYVSKKKISKSYFDSHPFVSDRQDAVITEDKFIVFTPEKPINPHFVSLLNTMSVGDSPYKGLIREQTYFHPEFGFAIDYPKHWQIQNLPDKVVAYPKNKRAYSILSSVEGGLSARQHTEKYIKGVLLNKGEQLQLKEHVISPNVNAYYIEQYGEDGSWVQVIWFDIKSVVYRVVTASDGAYIEALANSSFSLREINVTDYSQMALKEVVIETVNSEESIIELLQRINNVSTPEEIALINGFDVQAVLTENQQIKIIRLVTP